MLRFCDVECEAGLGVGIAALVEGSTIFSNRMTLQKPANPLFKHLGKLYWIFCALLCLLIVFGDSTLRWDIIRKVSAVTLTDVPAGSTPLPAGAHEEMLILPGGSMDARWWVLHTRQLLDTGNWRVRETPRDNAPLGREIHWSSGIFWTLSLLSHLLGWLENKPPSSQVSEAALWFGPLSLVLAGVLLALLAGRSFGLRTACFFVLVILTSIPIYQTFLLGEVDHHGLVLVLATGCTLCLVAGGSGWGARSGRGQRKSASSASWPEFPDRLSSKNWFLISGTLGGGALWISAATAIPVLLGLGSGAVLLFVFTKKNPPQTQPLPELWWKWSLAGALTSLAFYLLEYFPGHMGWRLEVNHPVYALAWLGGGAWLRALAQWKSGQSRIFQQPGVLPGLFLASLALLLPPALVMISPDRFFWVTDHFLLDLHREFITEFQSLPRFFQTNAAGSRYVYVMYFTWPVTFLLLAAWWGGARKFSERGWRSLLLLLPALLLLTALAFYQVRWFPMALGLWAVAGLILFLDMDASATRSGIVGRWVLRIVLPLAIVFALGPQMLIRHLQFETCTQPPISEDFGNGILLRDIGHRLVQSIPDRLPVVLTGPNSSTHLAYHSGVQTLGTLYWENMPGLKRAAEIFSAPDEASALRLLREAGITHLVLPSWDNFAQAYTALLATATGRQDNEAPFFQAIVEGSLTPQWLRPFCYPIPSGSALDTNSVKIFAFLPEQNAFEAAFFRGIYHFEAGEFPEAIQQFEEARRLRPSDPRPPAYIRQIRASSGS